MENIKEGMKISFKRYNDNGKLVNKTGIVFMCVYNEFGDKYFRVKFKDKEVTVYEEDIIKIHKK